MKKPKYLINERSSGAHGGLYELEEETYFDVVEIKTGKVLMTFERSTSATFGAGQWQYEGSGGVSKVELGQGGRSVYVHYYGKPEPEIVQLPK
jgi:hypothetical protein